MVKKVFPSALTPSSPPAPNGSALSTSLSSAPTAALSTMCAEVGVGSPSEVGRRRITRWMARASSARASLRALWWRSNRSSSENCKRTDQRFNFLCLDILPPPFPDLIAASHFPRFSPNREWGTKMKRTEVQETQSPSYIVGPC